MVRFVKFPIFSCFHHGRFHGIKRSDFFQIFIYCCRGFNRSQLPSSGSFVVDIDEMRDYLCCTTLLRQEFEYIFCGTKIVPITTANLLFPLSNIKKRQRDFWRSCSMLEEHEERVIQCSCIFTWFHSIFARRWHDQFLVVIQLDNQLCSFCFHSFLCNYNHSYSLMLFSPTRIDFHSSSTLSFHRALSCIHPPLLELAAVRSIST